MKEKNIELHQTYLATSPLLMGPVKGTVVAKNLHTCILRITEYQEIDETSVWELQKVIVVRYEDMVPINATLVETEGV